jgi:hypothetical protein
MCAGTRSRGRPCCLRPLQGKLNIDDIASAVPRRNGSPRSTWRPRTLLRKAHRSVESLSIQASGPEHRIVFVGGLHRSGTSVLARSIASHPSISALSNTGVPEDEGQHVQSVFPPALAFGGPGEFTFSDSAHLTEAAPLVTDENRTRLFTEWSRYWDLSKPVLLEKSPPNLIRSRFLASLFPESLFVMILRHPIAVTYATRKWRRASLSSLLRHWLHAHRLLAEDLARVDHAIVVHYEEFILHPEAVVSHVWSALGLESYPLSEEVRADGNDRYFTRWSSSHDPVRRAHRKLLVWRFEHEVADFGYSLKDVESLYPAPALGESLVHEIASAD